MSQADLEKFFNALDLIGWKTNTSNYFAKFKDIYQLHLDTFGNETVVGNLFLFFLVARTTDMMGLAESEDGGKVLYEKIKECFENTDIKKAFADFIDLLYGAYYYSLKQAFQDTSLKEKKNG